MSSPYLLALPLFLVAGLILLTARVRWQNRGNRRALSSCPWCKRKMHEHQVLKHVEQSHAAACGRMVADFNRVMREGKIS